MKGRVVWLLYEFEDLVGVYESADSAKAKAVAMNRGQAVEWKETKSDLAGSYMSYYDQHRFTIDPEWVHK